jgi:DNA modification methylase
MTLQLLNGDCLELMKTLPDKSIDLFVCDLPYGCLSSQNNNKRLMRIENGISTGPRAETKDGLLQGCSWDIKIDLVAFWVQVERLMKDDHTPIIHFCNTKFGNDLINSKEKWFRYDLVWNKMRGVSFLSANKMPMRSHELIYVFAKKGARYNRIDIDDETKKARIHTETTINSNTYNGGKPIPHVEMKYEAGKRCALSVVEVGHTSSKGKHPTQKPADLYEWLIARYSNEGDTILDPTAGSFASCFKAKEMGRNAIGMEMNKEFYDKANKLVE